MAINLESLSITSVFNSIISYFRSADNQTKFRELTTSSEGSFLIRMLANVFSAISYRVVAQSRENYLETAALTSSNIGIAQNLGYSVYRGENLKRLIEITPTESRVYPRLSIIGNYTDEYSIICLDETSLETGVTTNVRVVVGKVKEVTFKAGTQSIKPFTLFTPNISEDYALYMGPVETSVAIVDGVLRDVTGLTDVPTTKIVKELKDDKYLIQTNPYSSVDILYLNTTPNFQYKYGTDTEFTLRYVELADVSVNPFTTAMFNSIILNNYKTISLYQPFETVGNIKVNAPIDHEVQNLIRSKADYAKRLQEIVPSIIDSNFKALTPTYTLITYLKDDLTLISKNEEEKVLSLLEEENFFGTPLPDITVPRREVANLQIDMALKNKYKNISDIEVDINNILKNYYDTALGLSFNTFDFERRLEDLSYVRYARANHVVNNRIPSTNYQLGYILSYSDNNYIASQILGTSGSSEPNWNLPLKTPVAIDTGLETVDGGVIWRAYKKLDNVPNLSVWQPNFPYGTEEYVYSLNFPNYMFKCVDLIKSSGNTTPDITYASLGDFIVDGGIVWVVKNKVDANNWSSLTNYRLGDTVNVNSTATNSYREFSLECISYTGTVDSIKTLEFELPSYKITGVTNKSVSVDGNKTFYLRTGDVIEVVTSTGTITCTIESSSYSGSTRKTILTLKNVLDTTLTYVYLVGEERGTRDGQVLWKLIEDTNEIKYDWKSYATFDYNLNIVGN